jgi:hypothetical protein
MSEEGYGLTGISTADLEARIEHFLQEMAPRADHGSASFGVNAEEWKHLAAAVTEYIRICRNGRNARARSD